MSVHHLTVGQVAAVTDRPPWEVRRVVDQVIPDAPRAGQYRLVPRDRLADVCAELARRADHRRGGRDS